ncbi:astacin-like metalloprotease toxin 5 [Argiope bruennichi]|uniref:astacin-like metalloprotease toxin 5 n=1 Tax=Argiope bruennichi TaxID=94029 RepID=UPI0024957082|nr:astacin-like metalloprotease toxin 5 [Argiope bruennichi]
MTIRMIAFIFFLVASVIAIPVKKPDPMINEGLFEGDIAGIDPYKDRNAVPLDSQRWRNGIVPYVMDPSVTHMKASIEVAMGLIERNSCIHFKKRSKEHNYVRIFSGNGCWSYWGLLNQGEQKLSLDDRCDNMATILHELLHTLGFNHEHTRSDRDDYLNIHLENVDKAWQHVFNKLEDHENRLLTYFDYDSIMLYGERYYAKADGLKTMTAKDGRYLDEPYKKLTLSLLDIKRLNILYECRK